MLRDTRVGSGLLVSGFAACLIALIAGATGASAQNAPYPNRPIRLVVGFAAGAINDLTVRALTPGLSEILGQPVFIENKGGAGGLIAAETVARATADGYTLLLAPTSTMAVNPAVYSKLSYDPRRDFEPVSLMGSTALYLTVNANLPVKTLDELLAHARANPDKANYGAMATGFEVITAALQSRTGTKFETIQFKSTAETMASLLNGQIMIAYQDLNSLMPQLKTGKVRAIATTGSKRQTDLPDVPTIAELGYPDLFVDAIIGIVVPKGTPADVVAKLETAFQAVVKRPEVVERWKTLGLAPVGSSAKEYQVIINSEAERWSSLAKATNIRLD